MAIVKKTAGAAKSAATEEKTTTTKKAAPAKAPAKATKAPAKKAAPAKTETSNRFEVDLSNEKTLKKDDIGKLLANAVNDGFSAKDNNPLKRNITKLEALMIFDYIQEIFQTNVFENGLTAFFCDKQITKRPILGRTYPSLIEGAPETFKYPYYRMTLNKEIGGEVVSGTINSDGTFTTDDGTVINIEEVNAAFQNSEA